MKIWLVIERDYDWQSIRAAYASAELAEEHGRVMGFEVEEVEVTSALPAEAQDSPEKQQCRLDEAIERQRLHESRARYENDQARWRREFNPAEHVANGGGISLCHCRTFSTMREYFENQHGYCSYCGGTVPEVFRQLKGEEALYKEIDRLAEHDRIKMRELVGKP